MAWGVNARRAALAAVSVVMIAAVMTLVGRSVRPIGKVAGVLTEGFIAVAFALIWRQTSKRKSQAVVGVDPGVRSTATSDTDGSRQG
jgi:uncharacterized membrane protein